MNNTIMLDLGLPEICLLIDEYDKKIEVLEKQLAEKRYSFKYSRPEEYLASTAKLRKELDDLKRRDSCLVDYYNKLFDRSGGM